MATIFAKRELVSSFRSRSVVLNKRAAVTDNKTFFTQINLEFGSNGYFGLRTIINLAPLINAKRGSDIREKEMVSATEKLMGHFKAISEFIRIFDETIAWIKDPEHRFNAAYTVGHNPLFVHGSRTEKEIKIDVFGRYTEELSLAFEATTPEMIRDGIGRLNDLRECFAGYRESFKDIDLERLITL